MADVDAQRGERQRALGAYKQAREIIARLSEAAPSNATLPRDLRWFDQKIAGLEQTE